MVELCNILGISVNELLSGKEIKSENEFKTEAEKNLLFSLKERQSNKKKIILAIIVSIMFSLGSIPLIVLASMELINNIAIKTLLTVIAFVIIVLGIIVCCALDIEISYYECPNCHHLFIPNAKEYVKGMHTITKRRLKCPNCGQIK